MLNSMKTGSRTQADTELGDKVAVIIYDMAHDR